MISFFGHFVVVTLLANCEVMIFSTQKDSLTPSLSRSSSPLTSLAKTSFAAWCWTSIKGESVLMERDPNFLRLVFVPDVPVGFHFLRLAGAMGDSWQIWGTFLARSTSSRRCMALRCSRGARRRWEPSWGSDEVWLKTGLFLCWVTLGDQRSRWFSHPPSSSVGSEQRHLRFPGVQH